MIYHSYLDYVNKYCIMEFGAFVCLYTFDTFSLFQNLCV